MRLTVKQDKQLVLWVQIQRGRRLEHHHCLIRFLIISGSEAACAKASVDEETFHVILGSHVRVGGNDYSNNGTDHDNRTVSNKDNENNNVNNNYVC